MVKPERYVLYARGQLPTDPHSRMYVPIFAEDYQARTWLNEFIGHDEYSRDGNVITLPGGFTLKCEYLDRVMAAKPEGEVEPRHEKMIIRFKHGPWDGMSITPKPGRASADDTRAPRPERERRPECPPGYVTITALAASWGMLPTHARAALRASGREKPPYGWAFDPKEADAIKEIVASHS